MKKMIYQNTIFGGMNMNNGNRKPSILLSRNWIESSISDDIDKLEKQLNDIHQQK